VVCGDNHTVVLLETGEVYTFGKYQEGQLGRKKKGGKFGELCDTWHMSPGPVDDIGGVCKATWVGAKGNQTFIAIDEMLISKESLSQCKVFSNSQAIGEM
jgi:alpha-tubulin suppressor-like RCC1 family protein